jgi:uncharacterized protein YbjT (DUF2867 family)
MYVVTGATGNTGNIVATTLLEKGHPVRAIGRSTDRLTPLTAKGAKPFVGDLSNPEAMSKAFAGAKAAYIVIPPIMRTQDYRSDQARITEAIASALEKARVEYVVSLSSIGADKPDKTGPVVGLHHLEQRLNRIPGINVLHLRPGYFMENTLAQAGIIHAYGITSAPLRPDLKLPLIATRDIGAFAAESLLKLDFRGQQTRELLGQRDLSMTDATAIIAKAIDKPGLAYTQATDEEFRTALTQMGASQNMANLLLEMSTALNSGYMRALERRSAQNTTPTSYEDFVAKEFVPAYQRQSAAA